MQNSPELIIALGSDGEVRYLTPSARTTLGFEPAAVTRSLLTSLVHPEDLPRMSAWMKALRSATPWPASAATSSRC